MSLFINNNIEAMVAQNNLSNTENNLSTSMTDLSSGLRINTAADDAAGYAISEDLTGQTNGLIAGSGERAGRGFARPDRRRHAERRGVDAPARPRTRRPVRLRHTVRERPDGDHVRSQPADVGDLAGRFDRAVQRHRPVLGRDADHVPDRRQRQRHDLRHDRGDGEHGRDPLPRDHRVRNDTGRPSARRPCRRSTA